MQELAQTPKGRQLYAQSLGLLWVRTRSEPERSVCRRPDRRQAGADGYTFSMLFTDLTQADSFRVRVRATP